MPLRRSDRIEMQRRMLRIRAFDTKAVELKHGGEIPGPVHTTSGQEAAVVGACMALHRDDYLTGTHRSHGHPIAKGAALPPLMAELLGKETGVCKGKGGSMHLADFKVGSLGESGIVGAGIPIATGAGLSARVRGTNQVCVCFFGDGASNQGTFHESLNMAAIWKLPVVYFCENNLYAATTPAAHSTSVNDVADRASAYAIPGRAFDGQDVVATYEATLEAVERARRGLGPSLLEAKTYRYDEHAEGEGIPGFYRPADEIERWRERDPLALHAERLIEEGIASAERLAELDVEVSTEIEAALDFARSSDFPAPDEAFTDVYASSPPREATR